MLWFRSGLFILVATIGACALPTGPAGELSIASRYNPISHEVNSTGR